MILLNSAASVEREEEKEGEDIKEGISGEWIRILRRPGRAQMKSGRGRTKATD